MDIESVKQNAPGEVGSPRMQGRTGHEITNVKTSGPDSAQEASGDHTACPAGETAAEKPVLREEQLADILRSYGFKATDKNVSMLALMLENALPLTKENVVRMNQALKLTDSPEKALFLLQNGIRLTGANAAQLDGLVDGRIRVTEQINNLLNAISEIEDPALRTQLLRILSNVQGAQPSQTQAALAPQTQTLSADANASPSLTTPAAPAPQTPVLSADMSPSAQPQTSPAPLVQSPISQIQTPQADSNTTSTLMPPSALAPAGSSPAGQSPFGQLPINPLTEGTATPVSTPVSTAPPGAPPIAPPAEPTALQQAIPAKAAEPPVSPAQSAEGSPPADEAKPAHTLSRDEAFTRESAELPDEWVARTAHENRTSPSAAHERAPLRLSYKLTDSTPADIDRYVNSLRDALSEAHKVLTEKRNDTPEVARTLKEIQTLTEHIDFVTQIKNQLFVQLPVYYNGQETHTALHVYKDAKTNKQSGDRSQSALIALDTASMGHFETYVQKRSRSVTCQFRLRDKKVEQLVRNHIHKLNALLGEFHYTLDAFSFLPPGEPYTLLDSPDDLEGREKESSQSVFSFDKKV